MNMNIFDGIVSYAKSSYEDYKNEDQVSIEADVLQALVRAVGIIRSTPLFKQGTVPTNIVASQFNLDREPNEKWKTNAIGRRLSNMGFQPKRCFDSRGGFYIDRGLLTKLLNRYGIKEEMVLV